MKYFERVLVAIFALAILAHFNALNAQDFPSQPITILVPYNAGGATDTQSRVLGEQLSKSVGQTVVVENRPGGAAAVGMGQLARSAPDGYTFGISDISPIAISPHIFRKLPFDPLKDFQPLIQISDSDLILVVSPSLPVNSVAELIALLKANPGKYHYASYGQGSISHLAAELFKSQAKVEMTHVPYTGSTAAFVDLMAGRVPIMFSIAPPTIPHIKGGKLKALAVTGTKRNSAIPDVPTIAESGLPNYAATSWFAFLLPAKTPQPIVTRLNAEINSLLRKPDLIKKFESLGLTIVGGTPEQLASTMRVEQEKWGKVVHDAGLKPLD